MFTFFQIYILRRLPSIPLLHGGVSPTKIDFPQQILDESVADLQHVFQSSSRQMSLLPSS